MKVKGELLDFINRIYEAQLAYFELEALGARDINLDIHEMSFTFEVNNLNEILQKTSFFSRVGGKKTTIGKIIKEHKDILRKWQDNWFSHFVYPFKAKMRPMVARSLVNITGGGKVLDPMTGAGTANIEASLLGYPSVGVDVNPFYTAMTYGKWMFFKEPLDKKEAEHYWNRHALKQRTLRGESKKRKTKEVDSPHPLLPVVFSYANQMKDGDLSAYMRRIDELKDSYKVWRKIKKREQIKLGELRVKTASVEDLPFRSGSFNSIVTSPPYGTAIRYLDENPAPHFWDLSGVEEKLLDTKNISNYYDRLGRGYREMDRVLKDDGKVAIVIGNQKREGETIDIVGWTKEKFKEMGYEVELQFTELISSTGVWNILTDEILVFSK